tara:strand:- start:89 stop:835 length:747 start_codon:yes stop_codon:yes gene_type:complete
MRDLNDYKKQYGDYPFEPVLVHYRKRKILELLEANHPKRILEIGCGIDPLFKHYDGFEKICVLEPTESFYQNACRERGLSESAPRIEVRNKTLESDSAYLKSQSFDFVLLAGLLHEVEDPESFLLAVRECVPSHATLHVNVPNANSFHRLVALQAGLIQSQFEKSSSNLRFQQNSVFDMKGLGALLERCGFNVLESGTLFIKPFTHSQMQKMLDHEIIEERVLEGLHAMTDLLPDHGAEIFINATPAS